MVLTKSAIEVKNLSIEYHEYRREKVLSLGGREQFSL